MRRNDGTYWKVYNVSEDYTADGWVLVLASQQVDVPEQVKSLMEAIDD